VQISKRQKLEPSPEVTLVVSPLDEKPFSKAAVSGSTMPLVVKPVVSRSTRQTSVATKPIRGMPFEKHLCDSLI